MNKLEIQKELLYIGVKPSTKGFNYIADAIEMYSPGKKLMDLYILIAERNDDTVSRVERAVRHAKETMLNDNGGDITGKIYDKYKIKINIPDKFTNGDFIALMRIAIENMEATGSNAKKINNNQQDDRW